MFIVALQPDLNITAKGNILSALTTLAAAKYAGQSKLRGMVKYIGSSAVTQELPLVNLSGQSL
jgi:hypothetical protein